VKEIVAAAGILARTHPDRSSVGKRSFICVIAFVIMRAWVAFSLPFVETTMTASVLANENLTDRQLRFVYEYLQDHNASAAAVRAGYSEKSRASAAHELMNNPDVQALLRQELGDLLAELRCSALELMKERARAAFFRPGRMLKGNWEMRDLDEMDPEVLGTLEVRSVMRKSGPALYVKQPDRDKALRALERAHERLDRLNEKYWDRLEKQGVPSRLDEIEAEEEALAVAQVAAEAAAQAPEQAPEQAAAQAEEQAALVQVDECADKTMAFVGSGPAGVERGTPGGSESSVKTTVFSGSQVDAPSAGPHFSEKPMVSYGWAVDDRLPESASQAVREACAA
jgi:phage terminase small subunit